MKALPFQPNTQTHDHNTCIKHNLHHPIGKNAFPVNNCPNCIIDEINTPSLWGFSGYIKGHFLQSYQEDCYIVDVMFPRSKFDTSTCFYFVYMHQSACI